MTEIVTGAASRGRGPTVAGTNARVIDVVRLAYANDAALATLPPGAADLAVRYCADRRCEADRDFCDGCRLHTENAGLGSIDDWCARFQVISFEESPIRMSGAGATSLSAPRDLEALTKSWRGEEIWFLARRVHRRWHAAERRTETSLTEPRSPAVILMEPQLPENIGMVARAMANFGLDALRLIAPRRSWPDEDARVAAAGANAIIDATAAYPALAPAISDLNWLCATTARQRDLRKPILTPEQAANEMRRRADEGQRCGILFGRERNGLETAEVANADALVMIPVDTRFASLNLAQAVLILGYEWMQASSAASLGRVTTYETALEPGLNMGADRPSTKEELFGLFDHLEAELLRLGFFNPPHKRPTVVDNLRTMFTRMAPTEQEVRTLRGIVATLAKGKGHGRKPST